MSFLRRAPQPASADEAFGWAQHALADDDPERAVDLLDEVVSGHSYSDADTFRLRAAALRVEAQLDLEEVAAAARALDDLPEPEGAADSYAVGRALYRAGRFERARELLDRSVSWDSTRAEVWEQLAKTLLWLGDRPGADRAFLEAQTVDGDYALPFRVTGDEFEMMAGSAFETIPEPMLSMVVGDNLMIAAPPLPHRLEVEEGLNPDVLGYFQGTPGPPSLAGDGSFGESAIGGLKRISVFQTNHENIVTSRDELEDEVATTVLHEVAHYFGMDHAEIEAARLR